LRSLRRLVIDERVMRMGPDTVLFVERGRVGWKAFERFGRLTVE
jgi:hypothetical protein